jgi:sugar/nucleoside kinase (ribokinase family)
MTGRVLVLGDVMLDVVVRPEQAIRPTSDTPSSVRLGRGGAGANLAVALVAAGATDVAYLGVSGDDASADVFAAALRAAGVTSLVRRARGATGVVVSVVAPDGQRAMLTDRGVNSELTVDNVFEALTPEVSHLHVSGYLILDEARRHVARTALAAARERGCTTSVDVCSVGPLLEVGVANFLAAVGAVTFLFANDDEARALGEEALMLAASEVVLTRGAHGAEVLAHGERVHAPAATKLVVDTTGAGDAATGTYLARRLVGDDVERALKAAMTAAAHVVEGLGALGS